MEFFVIVSLNNSWNSVVEWNTFVYSIAPIMSW